jgi:hypothetical protein
MLKTVIDYPIFEHFTQNQPPQIPVGSVEENEYWNSFWRFLKEGSDVALVNLSNQQNIFLNHLTTGRKGTTLKIVEKFKKPHKCKFPKDQNIQTVFFLDEKSESDQKKYRTQNGFLFGFGNDYPEVWRRLSLQGKDKVIPVRKNAEKRLESWNRLSDYILPFTDMIIVDNYMFDETLWDYNLFKLIKEFAGKARVKFNLMLVSFSRDGFGPGFESKIKQKLSDLNIACNVSIIIAPSSIKEHDRGVFTNYLRLKSGDSFVYFDKNGKLITKGTEIDFYSMAEPDKFNASREALKNIKHIVTEVSNRKDKANRVFGNIVNKLIS